MPQKTSKYKPIAVVGISAIFPGSLTVTGYWKNILEKKDQMTDIPPNYWLIDDFYDPDPFAPDKTYCKRGAFIPEVDFDPMEFGIPPTNIESTDTSQLLALIVAKQVLEDAANGQFSDMDRERMSVILGVGGGLELLGEMTARLEKPILIKALREEGVPEDDVQRICNRIITYAKPWKESSFPGLLNNVIAGRIANRMDLKGTNCTTDAACASSFASLSMAMNELYLGQSDIVITGGVDTLNNPFMFLCFSKTPALSFKNECRPFSDKADGMMLGEGLGMVALKRLEDAERDGDKIYAVIKGVGASSDGKGSSIYSPAAKGQERAIERCYDIAGYSPDTVELVEAHGTGTMVGDEAEFKGLTTVFNKSGRKDRQWCALGTVKSQIGHTKSAAAVAGLIKAIMAVHHKVLPPTINIDKPDPKMDFKNSPFYLNTETRPWVGNESYPRRSSISSFGFGGTNFHVAIEEYRGPGKIAPRLNVSASKLVLLTESSSDELINLCKKTAEDTVNNEAFNYLSRASHENFNSDANNRLAIVATDENDLKKKLENAANIISKKPEESFSYPNGTHYSVTKISGSTAYLFPGQGSQSIGMSGGLATHFYEPQKVWDEIGKIKLSEDSSLKDIVFPKAVFTEEEKQDQKQKLTATEWGQPSLAATSIAMLSLLKTVGIKADCVGGHSLGEVTALYEAGVLDLESVLKVARKRGELMAVSSGISGSMTAITLPADETKLLLEKWGSDVVIANYNSPEQIVLSGPTSSIEVVEKKLKDETNISPIRLHVSTAFHSPLMKDACKPFGEFLKDIPFKEPKLPIYSNAEAAPYPKETDKIKNILEKQISHPVRFVEQIEAMYKSGVRTFIEVGAGSVLTNLTNSCLAGKPHLAVNMTRKTEDESTCFWNALGQLAVNGQKINFVELWKNFEPVKDPSKKKKPKLNYKLQGCNYGRKYPSIGADGEIKDFPKPNPTRKEIKEEIETNVRKELSKEINEAKMFVENSKKNVAANINHPQMELKSSNNKEKMETNRIMQSNSSQKENVPEINNDWLSAFNEIQKQTAEAYSIYQNSMAESHMAFLKSAELSNSTLHSLLTGEKTSFTQSLGIKEKKPGFNVQQGFDQGMESAAKERKDFTAESASPSVYTPSMAPSTAPSPESVPTIEIAETMPEQIAAEPSTVTVVPKTTTKKVDFKELMLDVVVEKTGYPKEILTMDMNLEADLGIDSIKRVEILSAIKDEVPSLPEVDMAEVAEIQTLGEVVEFIEKVVPSMEIPEEQNFGEMPSTTGKQTTTPANATSVITETVPAKDVFTKDIDLKELMLDVVVEKTGYPKEILTMDMNLEADLGIDSIKRVEILSAIKDEVPSLPEVDMAEVAEIQTLGEVAEFMERVMPKSEIIDTTSQTISSETAATESLTPAIPENIDFKEMMLDIVVEKTGYPKDVLTMDMNLEADLGIDSIKRVEILSAVKDEMPWLPEVDMAAVAEIQTLQEVVEFVEQISSSPASKEGVKPALAPKPEEGGETTKISSHYLKEIDSPASGFCMKGLMSGKTITITDDESGVADALVSKLEERAVNAVISDEVSENSGGVIFLGGLKKLKNDNETIAINREAFLTAKKVAKELNSSGGLFVTVQDTGGDFGLEGSKAKRVWLGGLPGLVKSAGIEWQKASVKAIDIDKGNKSANKIAEIIIDELFMGGPEIEVGLHKDGRRTTLKNFEPNIEAEEAENINKDSVILVSGGARGVTASCIVETARQFKPHFVLFGRTPLEDEPTCCSEAKNDGEIKKALMEDAKNSGEKITPAQLGSAAHKILANREIRETINALEEAGSKVKYIAEDITDKDKIAESLKTVRDEWGPVTGIIHGAGVLADKLIAEKTVDQFDTVFKTKIEGLRTLIEVTRNDPLKLICLFSSVAARFGNMGQCDYAMANEILNKVAAVESKKRGKDCVVKSLDWGPWDGGMVTPFLRNHMKKMGIPLIPIDAGAKRFAYEASHKTIGNAEIVVGPPLSKEDLSFGESINEKEFNIVVNRKNYPFIESHKIKGAHVVPVVMAIEWFSRAAKLNNPDQYIQSCKDLQVMKGIKLKNYNDTGDTFTIRVKELPSDKKTVLSLELLGSDDTLHYRSTIEMGNQPISSEKTLDDFPVDNLKNWDLDVSEAYKNKLFHGPYFQVIEILDKISDKGAEVVLSGTENKKWPGKMWVTDPASLDGGLQTALLWGDNMLGKFSLPTKIGAIYNYHSGLMESPIRCILQGKISGEQRSESDILFFNKEGSLLTEMKNVELCMIADIKPSTHQEA